MSFDPTITIAIITIYMLVALGIGLVAWRRQPSKDVEDYLLADRKIGYFVGFFSLAASQISALGFIGFIAFYYNFGIGAFIAITVANLAFLGGIYFFFGLKIWKLGQRFGHITPSDTIREYYNSDLLAYIIAFGLILALIPYLQVQFMGVGILLEIGTAGMVSFAVGAGFIAIVIAIYVWLGGMKSIAWVDTLQGVMLLGGTFLGGLFLLYTIGGGWTQGYQSVLETRPDLLAIPGPIGVFDWVFIVTFGIAVFWGWVWHPHMWMRVQFFKRGKAVAQLPWVWSLILLLTQIGGWAVVITGVMIFQDVPPDQFILLMYREFFHVVLFGLIISAALAAMMSSASSICHGIGAVASRDITQQIRPSWSEDRHLLTARVATMAAIAFAYILSLMGIPFLLTSGAAAAALATALVFPQIAVALLGWEWPTKIGAIVGSTLGGATTLFMILGVEFFGVVSPFGVYEGFWGLPVNVILFVVISLVTSEHPSSSTIEEWETTKNTSIPRLEAEFQITESGNPTDD